MYIPNLRYVKDNLKMYNKLMFLRFSLNEHEKCYSIFVRCQFSGIQPVLHHLADASCFKFRRRT
jgi:hypothetical protein